VHTDEDTLSYVFRQETPAGAIAGEHRPGGPGSMAPG
jgi:hypothetical protein